MMKKLGLLILGLSLVACGDTKNEKTLRRSPHPNPGVQGQGNKANLKCKNPIQMSDVSKKWKEIQRNDIVAGQAGTYKIKSVQLFGQLKNSGRLIATGSTMTTVVDSNTVEQSVICKDIPSREGRLTLDIRPQEEFSTVDGKFSTRRFISFILEKDQEKKSANLEIVQEDSSFGETSEKELEQMHVDGTKYEAKFYKVTDTEFEMRARVEALSSESKNQSFEMSFSIRYVLKRKN